MDRIKVYYANVPNMGDILNKDIIEHFTNKKVIRKNYLFGRISAIGSGLGNYTLEGPFWKNLLKRISVLISPNVDIWGTGFVCYKEKDAKLYKHTNFCAVRGQLSKNRIERIIGHKLDIPVGDAGILASYLIDTKKIEKKYDVGIIAHYKEKEEPIFMELHNKYNNSIIIDVQDSPINVINKIAECKTIISSSLHGLIIADSLHIPNVHIVVTNKLLGDGFKFDDYYSSYGLKHEYINMNESSINDLSQIIDNYKITQDMIETKKREMIECMPFKENRGRKND